MNTRLSEAEAQESKLKSTERFVRYLFQELAFLKINKIEYTHTHTPALGLLREIIDKILRRKARLVK